MSVWTFLVLMVVVVLVAGREKIGRLLARFDETNRRKVTALATAYRDPNAHFHLTIEEIDAQTSPVEPIWTEDTASGRLTPRYMWNGMAYNQEEDALEARRRHVLEKAHAFYREIDDLSRRSIPRTGCGQKRTP